MRHPAGRVAAVTFLAFAVVGCGRPRESEDPAAGPIVSVRTRGIEVREFVDSVSVPGQWRSAGDFIVAAPFAAIVDTLMVEVGDRLTPGQTLGWLETRESAAALAGAGLLAREAHDVAARAEADHALELALKNRVRLPLVSTVRGVVIRRAAAAGALVAESAEILAVIPDDALVFEARVPGRLAGQLHPGETARILQEGEPPRPARVQRLLPEVDAEDQSTRIWLSPAAGTVSPRLDRYGTAIIRLGPPRRALAVPDSAVIADDLTGRKQVALVSDGRAVWTVVALGAGSAGWHEVLSPGLAEGQLVIITGHHGLPDSTRVRSTP